MTTKSKDFSTNESGGSQTFAPEFRLALACAHWPLRAQDETEIRCLVREPLNWEWFRRIIERNQIFPLVYRNLRNSLGNEAAAETLGGLRNPALRHLDLLHHNMKQAAELLRVTESVRNAGFETLALKGLTLSAVAYGNIAMRTSGDIDLLVSAPHVFDVERVLISLGYQRLEPRAKLTPRRLKHYLRYYKHFGYFLEAKGVSLELHWRLFHNLPLLKQADAGFPPTISVAIGNGVVRTLSRSELFLYLCVHGAIHGWAIMKWIADIGALLSIMTREELDHVTALASERGLTAELRAALILVDLFLAVERPTFAPPREADPVVKRIVEMAQRLLTDKDYCLEIQRVPRLKMFLYDLRMRSSWRYRLEDIRRALVFPADWDLVDLPDALFPLYAVVRPVSWLLRHLLQPSRRPTADHSSRFHPVPSKQR